MSDVFFVPAFIQDTKMFLSLTDKEDTIEEICDKVTDICEQLNIPIIDLLIAKISIVGGAVEVIDLFESSKKSIRQVH